MTLFSGKLRNNFRLIHIWVLLFFVSSANAQSDAQHYEMDPITVTAPDLPFKESVKTKTFSLSDEREGGIFDVGDIARDIPGVSIPFDISASDSLVPYSNRGFTSYKIRGLGGNRVSLLIDGIRQPPEYTSSGGMGRTFFDPSIYRSVKIEKGTASSSKQSDAMSGSINFISDSMELDTFDENNLLNSRSRAKYLSVSDTINFLQKNKYRTPLLEYNAGVSYSTGHERKNDKGKIPANPMDYKQSHLLGTIKGQTDNYVFKVDAERYQYTSNVDLNHIEDFSYYDSSSIDFTSFNFLNPAGSDKIASGKDKIESENENIRERLSAEFLWSSFRFIENLNFKIYIQNSKSKNKGSERTTIIRDPSIAGYAIHNLDAADLTERSTRINDIGFDNHLYGLSIKGQKKIWVESHPVNLRSGAFLDTESGNNIFRRTDYNEPSEFQKNSSNMSNELVEVASPYYFDPSKLYRGEIFTDANFKLGNFECSMGVRFSHYKIDPNNDSVILSNSSTSARSDYENNSLTKSISITRSNNNSGYWLSYSEGVRNPSLENYVGFFNHGTFWIISNPNLKVERANTYEVGYYLNRSLFDLDISLYSTAYDGFFETVEVEGPDGQPAQQIQNISDSKIQGYEADLTFYLGDLCELFSGFSLNAKMVGSESENKSTGDGLDSVEPSQYIYSLKYDDSFEKIGFDVRLIKNSKKKNISSSWAYFIPPASTVVDASFYYKINDKSTLNFVVRNLLDEKYWLWANAGRVTHSFSEDEELAVMPGRNLIISYNQVF